MYLLSWLLACAPSTPYGSATLLSHRESEYSWAGYQNSVLQLEDRGQWPEGEAPRVQVFWPSLPDEDRDYPVLLFLHGGSADRDDEDPDGVLGRCAPGYASVNVNSQLRNSTFLHFAAQAGWVVLAPENRFCDAWVGQGEEDPVDALHAGELLIEESLTWLLEEQQFLSADETQLRMIGSSQGSLGAVWYAARHPGAFRSAVFSHGPTDAIRLYYEEGFDHEPLAVRQPMLEHLLGDQPFEEGPGSSPTRAMERYQMMSLSQGILQQSLSLPLMHLYSSADPISLAPAHEGVRELLEESHLDYPWVDYDSGEAYHGSLHSLDYPHVGLSAVRFLIQSQLEILEAEQSGAEVGSTLAGEDWWDASGSSVYYSNEPGLMLVFRPQAVPAAGETVRLTLMGFELPGELRVRLLDSDGALSESQLDGESWGHRSNDFTSLGESLSQATFTTTARGQPLAVEVWLESGEALVDLALMDWGAGELP